MSRPDGRQADELRPLTIEIGVNIYAEGSALITAGNTRVLCTASVEEKVPFYRKGTGEGWVTAEYAMLPRATNTRNLRDGRRGPRVSTRDNAAGLTHRELEVLSLVADGMRNGQIADRLVVSRKTVDHHVSSILGKLTVSTRTEAVSEARRRGVAL